MHSYSILLVELDVSVIIKYFTFEILVTNHRKKLLEKVENSFTTIFKSIYLKVQVGAKDSKSLRNFTDSVILYLYIFFFGKVVFLK